MYDADYYAAFIIDPDGYRIEAYYGPGERRRLRSAKAAAIYAKDARAISRTSTIRRFTKESEPSGRPYR